MRGKLLVALGLVLAVVAIAGLASLRAQESPEAPQVITIGSGGFLGVYLEEVDDAAMDRLSLREERGALIAEVSEDGPAAEAGLLKDDVIVEFNGEAVESISELSRMVRETPAGRTVAVGVVRDGQPREMSVELGERPGVVWLGPDVDRRQGVFIAPGDGEHGEHGEHQVFAFGGRGRLGVQLQSLGDQLAEYFGVTEGALIASVREDSPAAQAGLKAGDVITRVGDRAVDDVGDVAEAVHEAEEGSLSITVVRDGDTRTLTAELPERHSGNWDWGSEDGTYSYSFMLPDIEIPEIVVPEFNSPSVWFPEIKIPSFQFDWDKEDGEPWLVIPEITIPGFEIPEVFVPEIRVPEIEVPGREVTVQVPVQVV
jgi:membrane-associated protease RseP (regulator of RpoE activity)